MHSVFISYSYNDKYIADAICARFESEGVRCWYAPRDLPPGADWNTAITEAIEKSKVLVLVFTNEANNSGQTLNEVTAAVRAGVIVIPFKLTESMPTKSMQYYLSTVHWLDAMTLPLEKSIDNLDRMVTPLLSSAAPTEKSRRKKWIVPVTAAAAAVILIAAGTTAFLLLNGSKDDIEVPDKNLVTKNAAAPATEKETQFAFPLTIFNATEYYTAYYGSLQNVQNLHCRESDDGESIFITYMVDGKYELYQFKRSDGTLIRTEAGMDELPEDYWKN